MKQAKNKSGLPQKLSPKVDKTIWIVLSISIAIIFVYIITCDLPAWSKAWGLLFDVVFNIALSTVAATIFYFITVFLPYKKRYTDVSVFLLREYRGIIRLITHFELFLRGCTNSFEKEVNMDLVCEKFLNISNEGKAWENLFNQMCDICSTVDDFVRSYDEFLSAEVKEKAVRLHDNNAFYIALNTKNYREATKILRVSKSLGEYYCAAMNFAKLGNIMLNSK